MDDHKNYGQGSSGPATATALSNTGSSVKDKVTDAASDAKEQIAQVGRKASEKYQEATDYLRNADFKGWAKMLTVS